MSFGQYVDKEKQEYLPVHCAPGETAADMKSRKILKTKFAFNRLFTKLYFIFFFSYWLFYFFYRPAPPEFDELVDEYLAELGRTNFAANWSYEFTKAPHLAGTNYELVKWQAKKYEEFGLQNVEIEDYDIYLNYPVDHSLKLLSNSTVIYEPTLEEDILKEDPTTSGDDLVPAFHGYSASGNVTAEYIYANYGTLEDFEFLKANGIDVTGKIAIVRYGKLFRGLKVKFAQQFGAVGVLIYSEPSDDGEMVVENGYKAYPEGPARNPSSLQRGSVQFLSQIPGDPTTPGWPSKGDDIKRVDPYNSIPKIPSLPISYLEVKPILEKLNGHGKVFDDWKGSLKNVTYNVGPSPGIELNLFNLQEYNVTKLYNVYGEIPGKSKEVVMLGNHRDAWIKGGAGDPNSGSAVTLEVIRVFQHLKEKYNWKPARTIRFASWDGEEYALLGSTEYGEYHAEELKKDVVAYLNLDDAVAGTKLELEASPVLNKVMLKAAKKIEYPKNKTQTLYDHYFEHSKKVGILGSGSDFTVFLEHLGIPSLNMVFGQGPKDAIYHYHSNYDSFHWMSTFGDPGFVFHNAMAKFFGLTVLELTEPKELAFGLAENSKELKGYYDEVMDKVTKSLFKGVPHDAQKALHKTISETYKQLEKLIHRSFKVEKRLSVLVESYNFYDKEYSKYNPYAIYMKSKILFMINAWNTNIKSLEASFLDDSGLKNRPWFKHMVFAVDRNNGYSSTFLPGINEALDDGDFVEASYRFTAFKEGVEKAVWLLRKTDDLKDSGFFSQMC